MNPIGGRGGELRGANYIGGLRLFRGVPPGQVEALLAQCEVRDLRDEEVVLREGAAGQAIYLVISGEMRVRLEDGGTHVEIAIGPGECFGEMSVIDGREVSARVAANHDCRVLLIPRDLFWEKLLAIPGVAVNLLSTLVQRLRDTNDSLLEEQQRRMRYEWLQQEIRAAREIQSSMIPSREKLLPGRREFDCAGAMLPAVDVAGDFFDVCMLDDELMFFAVGDVSGKGVSAALFMAKTVPLLRLEAGRWKTVPQVLAAVNDALCENNPRCMFVTLGCGILDIRNGLLSYGNAGHLEPVLVRRGEPHFLPVSKDMVLGAMDSLEFQDDSVVLQPGDLLLLYSDGVTEAFDADNRAFGSDRLRACLRGTAEASATDIVRAVQDAVEAFVAGASQSDDITLFAVRYLGPEAERPG